MQHQVFSISVFSNCKCASFSRGHQSPAPKHGQLKQMKKELKVRIDKDVALQLLEVPEKSLQKFACVDMELQPCRMLTTGDATQDADFKSVNRAQHLVASILASLFSGSLSKQSYVASISNGFGQLYPVCCWEASIKSIDSHRYV
mmetsp:Transcript_23820/g.28759  ORF Transcript_23820/g.28759 Transcript_23820/m.28759 type:complete len:145 (-) Transcript_23820:94-528(-)